MTLTQARLKELLHYEPTTGVFTRLVSLSPKTQVGDSAGSVHTNLKRSRTSYLNISVDGVVYKGHRLAWFYMTGLWPTQIDHRDGEGLNNRWKNLREASSTEQIANTRRRRDNTVGAKGVSWKKSHGKYAARIGLGGKVLHIGYFGTVAEAAEAYNNRARELFGEFALVN